MNEELTWEEFKELNPVDFESYISETDFGTPYVIEFDAPDGEEHEFKIIVDADYIDIDDVDDPDHWNISGEYYTVSNYSESGEFGRKSNQETPFEIIKRLLETASLDKIKQVLIDSFGMSQEDLDNLAEYSIQYDDEASVEDMTDEEYREALLDGLYGYEDGPEEWMLDNQPVTRDEMFDAVERAADILGYEGAMVSGGVGCPDAQFDYVYLVASDSLTVEQVRETVDTYLKIMCGEYQPVAIAVELGDELLDSLSGISGPPDYQMDTMVEVVSDAHKEAVELLTL